MASRSAKRRRKRRRSGPAAGAGGAEDAAGSAPEQQRTARADQQAVARRRAAAADERPPAPWGSFPLIELTVLTGIVMLIAGFFFVEGDRSTLLIGTGLALGSIGGLELSIREHFAGYRSHTLVLAALPAAIVLGALFILDPEGLPPLVRAAIGAAVFAAAAALLVRVFRDRSGGESFRIAGRR